VPIPTLPELSIRSLSVGLDAPSAVVENTRRLGVSPEACAASASHCIYAAFLYDVPSKALKRSAPISWLLVARLSLDPQPKVRSAGPPPLVRTTPMWAVAAIADAV
jgi:hypothetical protein